MTAEIEAALTELATGERERALLERYVQLFLKRNAAMNLSAARTADAVAEHVADSIGIARLIREPFVDVGSGGGFPAIPIAIVTGMRGTLVESTAKKAKFLSEVVADLGLPLTIRAERAEDAARASELRGAFASATARAVSNASTVLELTIPFLEIGGMAILQRGKFDDRERAAAADAALVLGAEIVEERLLDDSDERRILLVRKAVATGQRFPRRAGIPAKRPLCLTVEADA